MSLSLITNPVGAGTEKIFAGFQPCEFVFKREDLAIIDIEAGTGGAKINHAGDLTSYLSEGDWVYIYSEGTNYIYDGVFEILEIAAGEITVDIAYIESATGGYFNYLKNYYVELQCVHPTLPDVNLLPFSLQTDGDSAGNIIIDVSIVNELNRQRGEIESKHITESVQEFEVKYRQVYTGSSESFTLVDDKKLIMLYAIDEPPENEIINNFDLPKLFLGYPASLVVAITERPASSTMELAYNEQNINGANVASGSLGVLDSDVNGFLMWLWPDDVTVNEVTKFINFDFAVDIDFDFAATDFDYPDFYTQEP